MKIRKQLRKCYIYGNLKVQFLEIIFDLRHTKQQRYVNWSEIQKEKERERERAKGN